VKNEGYDELFKGQHRDGRKRRETGENFSAEAISSVLVPSHPARYRNRQRRIALG
jgi:hypothetical protein